MEALQSGMVYGFAGQIDGLVRRITAELDRSDATPEAVMHAATHHLEDAR